VPTPSALLDELRDVGVDVQNVWELVNTKSRYPAAIPVLIDWLRRADEVVQPYEAERFKEGLVRALSVKEAHPAAAPVLIDQMRACGNRGDRWMGLPWAIGNALSIVADDTVFDPVVVLAYDTSLGRAREMLMYAIGAMKREDATGALLGLLDDPDVAGHAIDALAKRGDPAARDAFTAFADDQRAWVRRAAQRGLKKLDRLEDRTG
jgi:hypothetical protein